MGFGGGGGGGGNGGGGEETVGGSPDGSEGRETMGWEKSAWGPEDVRGLLPLLPLRSTILEPDLQFQILLIFNA